MAEPAALRYPPQVKYIVGAEALERLSFYGMTAILVVYLTGWLPSEYTDLDARAWYHAFLVVSSLTPLLGGWVADRLLGRYPVILWGALLHAAGLAALALWDARTGVLVGLALVAIASGCIRPCVSAFVGDQLQPGQARLLEGAYGWFYWVLSLGVFTARLLVPWVLRRHDPRVAFAVPALLMGLAALVFWAGTRHSVRVPPAGRDAHGFLRVVRSALRQLGTHRPGEHWLDPARLHHPAAAVEGARAVLRIAGVFAGVIVFWALFDQTGSSWVLQGQRMRTSLSALGLPGVDLDAAQLQALNPLLVMGLIPLLSFVVLPALGRRGADLSPLRKMTAGMFLAVASFVAAAAVQLVLDAGRPLHLLWQFPQYLLLTTAEVLVAVTGLEYSYTQAPRAMRSTVMSLWFLTVVLGNLLTLLVQFVKLGGAAYFVFFALLMLGAALAFRRLARHHHGSPPAAAG